VPDSRLVDGVGAPVVPPLRATVGVAGRVVLSCAEAKDDAVSVSGADDHVLRPGRAVDEVALPQRPLLALDDQHSLAGEHEEAFLIGFPVVHRLRLARAEHGEADSDLREVALASEAGLEPESPVDQRTSCRFSTNQPAPAANSPCSVCASGACGTISES